MSELEKDSKEFPSTTKGEIKIQKITDLRHVDVAILYGLGHKNRAHWVAKKLKPKEEFEWDAYDDWSEEDVERFMRSLSNNTTVAKNRRKTPVQRYLEMFGEINES